MLDQADQLPHGDLSPGHGGPGGGGEVGAGGVSLAPRGALAPLQTENNNWLRFVGTDAQSHNDLTSLTYPSLSVSVAHQKRVLTVLVAARGARWASEATVPRSPAKETELVDTAAPLPAEVGAAALSPKSGTVTRYWPGVSWLMQPLYWARW